MAKKDMTIVLTEIFGVLEKIYNQKQKESGMSTPIPYAYIQNDVTGELVIYSAWGKNSDKIVKHLKSMGVKHG